MADRSQHPGAVLSSLADEARLRAFAAVALGASTEADVAAAARLDPRRAARAVQRLVEVGVVELGEGGLRVVPAAFADAGRSVGRMRPSVQPEDVGATPEAAAI